MDTNATSVRHLALFAKYWQPGQVKSRLAANIGEQAASQLYRAFVTTLLRRLCRIADRRTIVFTPAERREAFDQIAGDDWSLAVQSDGDLGRRMRQFLLSAICAVPTRIVLIGTDSPTMPHQHIEQAFELLIDFPVVLGPTVDGGYCLVGIRDKVPEIFDDVSWSTPEVWRQTIAHLEASGTPFAQLPEWYDVDECDDLFRLDSELKPLALSDGVWNDLARITHQVAQRPTPGSDVGA